MEQPSEADLIELLEELSELAELHARNNLNICLQGGMMELLSLVFSHPSASVRKQACHLMTAIMANNR